MVSFVLNLPYTVFGIIVATILIPRSVKWNAKPMALIVRVRAIWPLDFAHSKGWRGTTVGHVIILNSREKQNDLAHELIHVEQLTRFPLIGPFLYVVELIKNGYRNNKYEIEAYTRSNSVYSGKETLREIE